MSHHKNERNALIARQYASGMTYQALADQYGVTASRICRIVHRLGGGASRERKTAYAMRNISFGGRKAVWPDCPEHLRDRYEKMKKRMGANAAKARIQAQERLKEEIAAHGPLAMAA